MGVSVQRIARREVLPMAFIDAGAIEPAGRGKVRFTHQSLRPWLRSQQ